MAIMQPLSVHQEFTFWIEYYEVCVISGSNSSLAVMTSCEASRSFRHPACDVEQRKSAQAGFGPDERQSKGKARNTTPGSFETTLIGALHLWWTRGVVGGNQVDGPIFHCLPKLLTVLAVADRRCTLIDSCPVLDGFRGEVQIVWACFDSYRECLGTSPTQFTKSAAGRDVHKMQTEFVLTAEGQQQANGRQLCLIGARLQVSFVISPIGLLESFVGLIERSRQFRVH